MEVCTDRETYQAYKIKRQAECYRRLATPQHHELGTESLNAGVTTPCLWFYSTTPDRLQKINYDNFFPYI
jgi:hypothetical protein